jgi:hypothetical protein
MAVGVACELTPVAVAGWLRVGHVAGCGRRCWLRGWVRARCLLAGVAGCRLAWWT